ncbi:hypothetical protein L1987_22737 [Smallanthus sonchifolius]|uniref:Uncharacterized protein n=1 Tax=Smallanthus sonchifolius TaxID=185202 RepID=A0ACB9IG88_9ASTR|nr:hypothetical protein L1987_22737 [Smallanthus sonchifolius]
MEKGHGSIKGGNREHGLILSYEERKPLKPLLVLALPCFHGTHVHSEKTVETAVGACFALLPRDTCSLRISSTLDHPEIHSPARYNRKSLDSHIKEVPQSPNSVTGSRNKCLHKDLSSICCELETLEFSYSMIFCFIG